MSIGLQQRQDEPSSIVKTEIRFEQFNICLPLIIKHGSMSIKRIRTTICQLTEHYEIFRTNKNLFPLQMIHTNQNLENIVNFLKKIHNDRAVRYYLIKRNKVNADCLHLDDLLVFVFNRPAFNSISLRTFLNIFIQIYDNNNQSTVNLSENLYQSILDGYQSHYNSTFSNLRHSIDFTIDSTIVNNQIQLASSNDFTLFHINLACFLLFSYKLDENSVDDLCTLCSTDTFNHVHPFRIQIQTNELFSNFLHRIQRLYAKMIEYDQHLSIYDSFNSFNIPFYFQYNNSNMSSKIELTTNEVSLNIYPNDTILNDKYIYLSNLSLTMIYDDDLRTLNCTLTGSSDSYEHQEIVDISHKYQRFLSELFSRIKTTSESIDIHSLPSLDKPSIQKRLSIFDADLPSAITIDSEHKHSCRKWLGVIWLIIELNLVSGNIYGFTALSKILPMYSIYNGSCISSNKNSTELDCSEQTKAYQNALTLGLIFFNIPSVFTGILIDRYGTRFTRLIAIIFYIIGWFALAIIEPGRDGLLFAHTLFTSLGGKMIQMSGYASANYFSKARAYVLTALVGSSSASPIWYSLFQVLINRQILTLYQISYIWMSFSILLLCSSFLFLDWTFPILNLPYKFDTHLEESSSEDKCKQDTKHIWYQKIYHRYGVWEHIISPLYILLILFLSFVIMPSVFLSVTWYPWVYFITNNNMKQSDNYTLAYNLSTLLMLVLCPLTGFLLGFRAEKNLKRKCLNISIIQTFSWLLNIASCAVYMSMTRTTIISAIVINAIARATLISSSQAVVATFFPSKYIGRLTGIMWSMVGLTICLQYGLVKLTAAVPDSWKAWSIILAMGTATFSHIVYLWIKYIRIGKK